VPLGVWIAALIARATGGELRVGEVGSTAIEIELPGAR
jgi:hypothetical protein